MVFDLMARRDFDWSDNVFVEAYIAPETNTSTPSTSLGIINRNNLFFEAGRAIFGALGAEAKNLSPAVGVSAKRIRFNDAYKNNTTAGHFFIEIKPPTPLLPNTPYWLVLRTTSSGHSLFVQFQNDSANNHPIFWASVSKDGGSTWSKGITAGGDADNTNPANSTLTMTGWIQLSLTSSGEITNANGNGGGLTVWDPYTGKAQTAQDYNYNNRRSLAASDMTGLANGQIGSIIDFPTAIIARKNAVGQVDVTLTASAGGTSGMTKIGKNNPAAGAYGRWNYNCTIQYVEG